MVNADPTNPGSLPPDSSGLDELSPPMTPEESLADLPITPDDTSSAEPVLTPPNDTPQSPPAGLVSHSSPDSSPPTPPSKSSSTQSYRLAKIKKSKLKALIGGLVVLVLVIGGGVGVYLSSQKQDVRQQASGCQCSDYHNDEIGCDDVDGCSFRRTTAACTISNCSSTSGCTCVETCQSISGSTNQEAICNPKSQSNCTGICEWGTTGTTGTPTAGSCTGTCSSVLPTATIPAPASTPIPGSDIKCTPGEVVCDQDGITKKTCNAGGKTYSGERCLVMCVDGACVTPTLGQAGATATPSPGGVVPGGATSPPSQTLQPPTNVAAVCDGGGKVTISWTGSAGATSYTLAKKTGDSAWNYNSQTINSGGTTNTSDTVELGTAYAYNVKAYKDSLSSEYGNQFNIICPQPPTNIIATCGVNSENGQVNISWTASPDATSYTLSRKVADGAWNYDYRDIPVGTTSVSESVEQGVAYAYNVKAYIKASPTNYKKQFTYGNQVNVTCSVATQTPTPIPQPSVSTAKPHSPVISGITTNGCYPNLPEVFYIGLDEYTRSLTTYDAFDAWARVIKGKVASNVAGTSLLDGDKIYTSDWSCNRSAWNPASAIDPQAELNKVFAFPNTKWQRGPGGANCAGVDNDPVNLITGEYTFRSLVAGRQGDQAVQSDPVSIYFSVDRTPPVFAGPLRVTKPTDFCKNGSINSFRLDWDPATDIGCAGAPIYHVDIATDDNFNNIIKQQNPTTLKYEFGDINIASSQLFARVITTDSIGNASQPNILSLTCDGEVRTGYCGDGVKDEEEQCDFGKLNNDTQPNTCRTNCRFPNCGDRVTDIGGEDCDDGNLINGDGCSDTCRLETYTLEGMAWEDANLNGLKDISEQGVCDTKVQLYFNDSSNPMGERVTKCANSASMADIGKYDFTNLPAGTYKIKFTPRINYIITTPNRGSNDAIDSDANANGWTDEFTINSNNTKIDVGLYLPMCKSLNMSPNAPKIGQTATLTCATVTSAHHYNFRYAIRSTNSSTYGEYLPLTANSSAPTTASLTISQPGSYKVQCQACFDSTNNQCSPYQ